MGSKKNFFLSQVLDMNWRKWYFFQAMQGRDCPFGIAKIFGITPASPDGVAGIGKGRG